MTTPTPPERPGLVPVPDPTIAVMIAEDEGGRRALHARLAADHCVWCDEEIPVRPRRSECRPSWVPYHALGHHRSTLYACRQVPCRNAVCPRSADFRQPDEVVDVSDVRSIRFVREDGIYPHRHGENGELEATPDEDFPPYLIPQQFVGVFRSAFTEEPIQNRTPFARLCLGRVVLFTIPVLLVVGLLCMISVEGLYQLSDMGASLGSWFHVSLVLALTIVVYLMVMAGVAVVELTRRLRPVAFPKRCLEHELDRWSFQNKCISTRERLRSLPRRE